MDEIIWAYLSFLGIFLGFGILAYLAGDAHLAGYEKGYTAGKHDGERNKLIEWADGTRSYANPENIDPTKEYTIIQ